MGGTTQKAPFKSKQMKFTGQPQRCVVLALIKMNLSALIHYGTNRRSGQPFSSFDARDQSQLHEGVLFGLDFIQLGC
jgi:hypothetical protein